MRKKRILLLSEGFGSGHTQAAHALAVAIRHMSKQVVTRVIELGSFQHPTMAPFIYNVYRKALTTTPELYGRLYRRKREVPLGKVSKMALHRLFYSKTSSIIRQLRPDIVVCTHPFPALVVSRLKQSGLQVPLCGVITDYDAHASWVDEQIDQYLVSTPGVKDGLILKGIPGDRIHVTGIPVHPKFWTTHNLDDVRSQFGLQPIPTVLIMGGGWGLEDEEVMEATVEWRDKLQLLYCLGNNDKARLRYEADERFCHPNVKLLGYTKDVDKLMEVSDLLLTKPGGMTCTEGMAKGIPMLFYKPIPGQEEENCDYFISNGIGERIEGRETIHNRFTKLWEEPEDLNGRRMRREAAGLSEVKDGPQTILEMLQWG